ncbi:MAG: DUF4838 domain-containing protein [Lentisphaeria bacterium]|nr:DUF4838 domain-containing protein [Lentisphaeria bacterium]
MKKHLLIAGILFSGILSAAQLTLSENGKTDFVLVPVQNATAMEQLAYRELQAYLKKSTGADFRQTGKNPTGKIILKRDSSLKPEESAVSIKGNDLILSGGDEWGILYAVYSFLENQVGIRWFSPYGHEKIPAHKTLKVDFKDYRQKPAYINRALIGSSYYKFPYSSMFFLRNRLNINNALKNPGYPGSKPKISEQGPQCHTLFYYIPPAKGRYPKGLKFKAEKYYFKDHPEYFSIDQNGKRTMNMQLCFSDPGLRKEFTQRFLEYAELSGGKGMYSISAQDWPGKFCCCQNCDALEKKYRCISGPMIDYIIELCGIVKNKYPELLISTLSYRKQQSEVPPYLGKGKRMPDNFVCVFAPIDDDFSKTLAHKNNRGTLENLKKWAKITDKILLWYYPIVYGGVLPSGCVERSMRDTKIMFDAGATGTYYEHDVGVFNGLNFGDMMTWMFLKLFQNPNADYKALMKEFCDYYYGAAADDMISYINELDRLTAAIPVSRSWNSGDYPKLFEAENLIRWQKLFDRMLKKTASDTAVQKRIRDVRIALDLASLKYNYRNLQKKAPALFPAVPEMKKRIISALEDSLNRRVPANMASLKKLWMKGVLTSLETYSIYAAVEPKPLPAPLDKVDPAKIRQVFASQVNRCGFEKTSDAAFGQAIYDNKKPFELPFTCGFYDVSGKRFLLTRKIQKHEIVPDKYALYKVGEAPITSQNNLWAMSSWRAGINLSSLYIPGEAPDKKYEIWLSLKFEGPGYSPESKSKINRVWIDRAVVVEK